MHRTLKAEVASPLKDAWQEQREALEARRREFNEHNLTKPLMQTPASRHTPSQRPFPEQIGNPEYPITSKGAESGDRCDLDKDQHVVLSHVLCRECAGLEPVEDGLWHLWFGPVFLGRLRALDRIKYSVQKQSLRRTKR